MNALDLASVLRRVEAIAEKGTASWPADPADALAIMLTRLDALADDLRKGLHGGDELGGDELAAGDAQADAAAAAAAADTYLQTGGEMA